MTQHCPGIIGEGRCNDLHLTLTEGVENWSRRTIAFKIAYVISNPCTVGTLKMNTSITPINLVEVNTKQGFD